MINKDTEAPWVAHPSFSSANRNFLDATVATESETERAERHREKMREIFIISPEG